MTLSTIVKYTLEVTTRYPLWIELFLTVVGERQTVIQTAKAYRCKVRLGDSTGSGVEAEFHLTDLSVHVFHESERFDHNQNDSGNFWQPDCIK